MTAATLMSDPPMRDVIPQIADFPEDSTDTRVPERNAALPVTVQTSFVVASSHGNLWLEASKRMVSLAASWPGCRGFRPMQVHSNRSHHTIISTWDDMGTYHRFVRESGMLWLVRAMGDARMSSEICGLENT